MKLRFNKDDYSTLITDFSDEYTTQKNCSVTVCKVGHNGFCSTDGTFKLLYVYDGVDVYDIDGSEFFIVKDGKAILIIEPIAFTSADELFDYMIELNVDSDKIDPRIKETETDWYVTSREDIID